MSLILDAINRSQRERAAPGEVPGVATVHYAEATVAPRAWGQGLLGLLLVIAVGVIAWLVLRPAPLTEHPAPAPAPQQRVAPAPSADPATQPAAASSRQVVESGPQEGGPAPAASTDSPPPAVAPEVAALYAGSTLSEGAPGSPDIPGRERANDSAAAQVKPAPEPHASPAAAQEPAPAGKTAEEKAPEETASEEQELDVEALLRAAQREMASEELSEHPAPFLSALSQQRKDAIPTLLYSAHDYRGDSGNSTVLINGKTARAGQGIGKGVSVVEILPDSVVLEFAGKQFRLRALNSWVNL